MKVICDLYARVSTTEQADDGYSLGEQEARLRAYAAAQGWAVNAFYCDPGFSGAKLDRPGIQHVIEDAQAHRINKIITYKLDRLSRSQKDTLYLIEDVFIPNGVDYVSMTESLDTGTPFGMAMTGILSVFAQLEREQIAERMTMGRIASAKEGNWRGGSGAPIGYRYRRKTADAPGELVVDDYEAQIVRKVFELFLQGKTFHAIWEYCRARFDTSYGKFGNGGANIIPVMLSNQTYIGRINYAGETYPGRHEPIIDQATFDRVQDLLVEYRATLDDHRRKPFEAGHLLTGLLYCSECGARWCYHGGSYVNKAGERKTYGTYQCYTKNAHKRQRRADRCSLSVWPSAKLEETVWSQLRELKYEDIQAAPDADQLQLKANMERISALDRSLERLVDLYALGTLPLEQIEKRSADFRAQKEKLQQECEVIRRRSTKLSPEELADALGRLESVYASGDLEAQRDLLRQLIKRIVLGPNRAVTIEWNV